MAKPDFLCIGAQKGGTTWLDQMFRFHPEIWTPPVKELQFFNELYMPDTFKWTKSHRDRHAANVIRYLDLEKVNWLRVELATHIASKEISYDWYERIFDFASNGTVKGEMTPEYSLLPEESIAQIYERYPQLKIIFVIRDPAERALSGIKMRLAQKGFDGNSPQEIIDSFVIKCAREWDVIERGNYKKIIALWEKFFTSNNFLLLFSNDFHESPVASLRQVSNFLNVDAGLFSSDPNKKVHVGRHFNISDHALEEVRRYQADNLEFYEGLFKDRISG